MPDRVLDWLEKDQRAIKTIGRELGSRITFRVPTEFAVTVDDRTKCIVLGPDEKPVGVIQCNGLPGSSIFAGVVRAYASCQDEPLAVTKELLGELPVATICA